MLIYIHSLYTFICKILAEIRTEYNDCNVGNLCIKSPSIGKNILSTRTTCSTEKGNIIKYVHKALPDTDEDDFLLSVK